VTLLPPGARVAVVAPASAYDPAKLDTGLALARAEGWALVPFDDMLVPHWGFAAHDDRRLAHLLEALTSPDFDAVWAVRGGFGVTRLLPRIPFETLPPRPVIGFSDLTPLLEALRVRVGSPVVHGPVLHSLGDTSTETRTAFFDLLHGRPVAPLVGEIWQDGTACGPLVGGNLCMLAATAGTPFALDARGAIVCLEDIAEPAYRIDRMLQQLVSSGALDHAAGFALGDFSTCRATRGEGWHVDDVLRDHLLPFGKPVLAGLPIGHGADNVGLPLGVSARIAHGTLSWSTPPESGPVQA
jgi:muramoyltetrapeptide carboxypeptidase